MILTLPEIDELHGAIVACPKHSINEVSNTVPDGMGPADLWARNGVPQLAQGVVMADPRQRTAPGKGDRRQSQSPPCFALETYSPSRKAK